MYIRWPSINHVLIHCCKETGEYSERTKSGHKIKCWLYDTWFIDTLILVVISAIMEISKFRRKIYFNQLKTSALKSHGRGKIELQACVKDNGVMKYKFIIITAFFSNFLCQN